MEKLSPMLQQYMDLKNEYPDTLILFRLGDFYELFYEDAKIASYELDLVLTGRAAGNNQKAPMCGVPFHAINGYVKTLVNNGHKVAIVEQLEDPAQAKGLVKRDVVKVVTPGTMTDEWVDDKSRNILGSLTRFAQNYTLVLVELMSGSTTIHVFSAQTVLLKERLLKEGVREIILDPKVDIETLHALRELPLCTLSYESQTQIPSDYELNISGIEDETKRMTYGRLIQSLLKSQKRSLYHLRKVVDEKSSQHMALDYRSLINLELIDPLRSMGKEATLFHFLDHCKTAMGSRLLKDWIKEPYKRREPIIDRQAKIQSLLDQKLKHEELRDRLSTVYDLERICGKIAINSANPQDIVRLAKSLDPVQSILNGLDEQAFQLLKSIDPLTDISILLNSALNEEAPGHVRDGNIFKSGYHADLDELRSIQRNGRQWLLSFENREKERTQIKNLKVGYNRVFGYYIEISKGNASLVKPEFNYTRRQTLSTGERFITPELKEMEDKILHAQEKALRLEQALFEGLIETLFNHLKELQILADALSQIDAIQALATVSREHHYVCPEIHEGFETEIIEGRHPILETKLKYVSNTSHFEANAYLHLLTGPNMGGKSTYMRQVALIQILAQMGCFVPAKSAKIALVDAIYTRMGASDDILEGHSTFMLEMTEANTALQHATEQSLILFDEIGRGTSTFDGMALAHAMVEYISTVNRCKTIFSTHYHELTQLEESLKNLKNMHVDVHEENNEVTFLYRVKHGKADRSYGVNVARLAKLPPYILDRASTLLNQLESKKRVVQQAMEIVEVKHTPLEVQHIQDSLRQLKIEETTPLEALQILSDLKKQVKS